MQQLTDTDEFEQPKITSRIKDRDECLRKFDLKYRNDAEKQDGGYDVSSYITDLIGVRIISLYETDIPKIQNIIEKEFDVISITDKTQALISEINTFGYKGLHFDARLTRERCKLSEYQRFSEMRFEIQIRSIVQDAWSEVEHRLRYKKQPPPMLHRRISRLSALFEIADQEFAALQEETERLELAALSAKDEEVHSDSENILDSFAFLAIVSKIHPKYKWEAKAVDGFVDEIIRANSRFSVKELNTAIRRFRQSVWEYKKFQQSQDLNINPYTEIRHVLYVYDKYCFADMLYPNQRESFTEWMKNQKNVIV